MLTKHISWSSVLKDFILQLEKNGAGRGWPGPCADGAATVFSATVHLLPFSEESTAKAAKPSVRTGPEARNPPAETWQPGSDQTWPGPAAGPGRRGH